MAPETPPPPTARWPPPWMLVMLGIAVVALVAYVVWPAAGTSTSAGVPSNQQREARGPAAHAQDTSVASLHVKIGELKTPPPEPTEGQRNPFRFQPKAPPPPPLSERPAARPDNAAPGAPSGPPGPPPIPPIPLKFIGTMEGRGPGKVAIFSDSRGTPVYGHEGDIILGQYRVVRIGVESVVMEYADGRGRQTIPLRGQ